MQAFRDAFAGLRGDFYGPIVSSILVSVTATALSVFLGSMAAYALVRFDFRIRLLAGVIFAIICHRGLRPAERGHGPAACPTSLLIVLVIGAVLSNLWPTACPCRGPSWATTT